jgi:hypothetical protein
MTKMLLPDGRRHGDERTVAFSLPFWMQGRDSIWQRGRESLPDHGLVVDMWNVGFFCNF